MYRAQPDGLAGNEDCGQMSAWYLMNAMGFYSVAPGSSRYQLGSPQFDKMALTLESGDQLTIKAHDNSDENIYVAKVQFNGQVIKDHTIDHKLIREGGLLEFFMSSEPQG